MYVLVPVAAPDARAAVLASCLLTTSQQQTTLMYYLYIGLGY